jgi:hypothetical protein
MVKVIVFYRYYHVTHAVFGPMWIHDYLPPTTWNQKFESLDFLVKEKSGLSENLLSTVEITGLTILPND